MTRRIKGPFAAIRVGLLAHMPTLGRNPSAAVIYLYCHLKANRKGPEPGVVQFSGRQAAEDLSWGRNRVIRCLRWLERTPRPDKPWLVRLNPNARGQMYRYYIRNFDGNDPTDGPEKWLPHSDTTSRGSTGSTGDTTSGAAHGATPPAPSGSTLGSTGDATSSKVAPLWAPPTEPPLTNDTRALRQQSKKTTEGAISDEETDLNENPPITGWFKDEGQLRDYAKENIIPGLPEELVPATLDSIVEHSHRHGLAILPAEEKQA